MEDYNKEKRITKNIIIIISIIILLIIGIIIYINIATKSNTKKFKKYIENNYDTDINSSIYYTVYNDKYILSKTTKLDNTLNSKVTININKEKKITGTLELFGTNKYGNEGISYLESTYKNKKFECNFISNKGYKARCDILKKYSTEFEKEFNEILKKSKTKFRYINPQQKPTK